MREGDTVWCDRAGKGKVVFASSHLSLVEWSDGYVECVPSSRTDLSVQRASPHSGLLEELESLIEEDPQNPFSNKSSIGPGPEGERLTQKKRWSCSGSDYSYRCVGIADDNKDQVIQVKVDPDKKAAYNKKYKRFRKLHRSRYQRGSK